MFEDLINKLDNFKNEIENLEKTGSVKIEVDEDGYTDRECPNEDCLFPFKVFEEDWINLFKDEAVFCPKCRQEEKSNSFWSSSHLDIIKNKIIERIHDAWDGRTIPSNIVDSVPALEIYKQKHDCENCSARYSVIGATYFCPCCGHNSILKTFNETLNKVEIKISNIPIILEQLKDLNDADQAEIIATSLIESSLSDIVVGFQRYLEERFIQVTGKSLKRNPFQNLKRGSDAWKEFFGFEYSDFISKYELARLNTAFQQRHLFQHNEGIVDQEYINKSEDTSYKIGQRVVLKPDFIIESKQIVKLLITSMNKKIKK